ncbi:hypothetical protein OCL06_15935 [Alteromonas sp. ASW11-19]|uniref:Uncharacterized protein n=1 Tax=Alteromonas salexigens TaxID=2982530 RepID=A0ABT2VT18_9ALTE|nr:hypothetical protein [Alteromonas salexigens]MCU7556082.1 hypothetical protein [Alteromonas salexigens]
MSDNTSVELTLRVTDFHTHQDLFDDNCTVLVGDHTMAGAHSYLVEVSYSRCNGGEIGIEAALQARGIPYDKCWGAGDEFTSGMETARVLPNGQIVTKRIYDDEAGRVSLADIDAAIRANDLEAVLQAKRREFHIMPWDVQLNILEARKDAAAQLVAMSQEALDELVTDFAFGASTDARNATDDEQEQETLLSQTESMVSDICNQGKEAQAEWLLSHGYMTETLVQLQRESKQAEDDATATPVEAPGMRYFVCAITEVNGFYEYTSEFLMTVAPDACPNERLTDIFVHYRGDEGELDGEDTVTYECGTVAKNPTMREISYMEYGIMEKYLGRL